MFNKKNLLTYPEKRVKKVDELFSASEETKVVVIPKSSVIDGRRILILDFFTRNSLIRTFIHTRKGVIDEFISYDFKTKTWKKANIFNLSRKEKCLYGQGFVRVIDCNFALLKKEVILDFLKLGKTAPISNRQILNIIDNQMLEIKDNKRAEKAQQVDKIMNKVPPLSPTQEKWIRDNFLKFRNVTRNECNVSKSYKYFYPFFITKVDGIPIVRHFKATVNQRTKELWYNEFCRDIYDGNSVTSYEPGNIYSSIDYRVIYSGWVKGRKFEHYRYFPGPLYTRNINSVIKNTVFQYSGILEYHNSFGDSPIGFWDHYLTAQQAMPQLEYLAKEGLNFLTEDISMDFFWRKINPYRFANGRSNAKENIELLNPDAVTYLQFLGINKKMFMLFKEHHNNFGTDELSFLRFYQESGLSVTKETLIDLVMVNQANSFTAKAAIKNLRTLSFNFNKICNYLKSQCVDKEDCEDDSTYYSCLERTYSLYDDYLKFCKDLGYDLSQKAVAMPKNLEDAHDKASEAIDIRNNPDLYIGFRAMRNALKPLDNMVIGEYIFKIPMSKKAFVKHGQPLHQCVGNGRYFQEMAEHKGLIVFVNKADAPNVPYLTLEIKNGAEAQFRGLYNKAAPDDARIAVKHFLRQLNRVTVFSENSITVDKEKAEKIVALNVA